MSEDHDKLSELYRRSSQETPPAHVDRAVLDQARKSVRRKVYAPFGSNWVRGGAMLGVIVLSVLLLLDMPQQPTLPVPDAMAPLSDDVMDVQGEVREERQPSAAAKSRVPALQMELPAEAQMNRLELKKESYVSSQPPPPPADKLYLQSEVFYDSSHAVDLQARLAALGFSCEVREDSSVDAGTVYRIHIGPFADPDAREQARQRLDALGIATEATSEPGQE